jgi:hypothetical protein
LFGAAFPVEPAFTATIAATRSLARVTLFWPSLVALAKVAVVIASVAAKRKSRDSRRLTRKILTLLPGIYRPLYR